MPMKTIFFILALEMLASCAPVRFSTEAEKRRSDNETRARIGLPPRNYKQELEGSGLEKLNTVPQQIDSAQ
jgi:hypothetical protein